MVLGVKLITFGHDQTYFSASATIVGQLHIFSRDETQEQECTTFHGKLTAIGVVDDLVRVIWNSSESYL
ncbi:hypothetical protein CMV_013972 [Castanea mollissima]|uniref:Uncharacterized protein n=1 Tax=Castanea mollissima TaxID=60419 RepID=A0A8J4R0C9_9ROSI|nr:hypothetical protein CMV_013972 [Castanea mollissima]